MSFNPTGPGGIPNPSEIQDQIEQAEQDAQEQESDDGGQPTPGVPDSVAGVDIPDDPSNLPDSVGGVDIPDSVAGVDIPDGGQDQQPAPEPEPSSDPEPEPAPDTTDEPPAPPETGPGGIPQGEQVSQPDPTPTPDPEPSEPETPQGVPPDPESGPSSGQDTQDTPETGPGGIPVGEEVGNRGTPTDEQTTTATGGPERVYGGEMVELESGRLVSDTRFETLQRGLERIQEENPNTPVDEVSDIRLGETDDGQRVFETSTQFGEEQYAAAVEEETGVETDTEDVIQSDQGPTLGPAAEDRVQIAATEEAAVEQFDERFPGVDITAEDVSARQDGSASLLLDTQREIAAQQLDEQTDTEVTPGDVQFTPGGEFQLTPEVQGQEQTIAQGGQQGAPEQSAQQGGDLQLDPGAFDPSGPDLPDDGGLSQDIQQNQQVTAAPEFDGDSPEVQSALRQTEQERSQTLADEYPSIAQDIEQSLEEETGADLSTEDIVLTRDDGRISGRLSEQGQESVEVQQTPLADVPVVGGVLTTGTRVRQDIREATEGPRTAFQDATPDANSVVGLLGAAAPVAAAEPTPFGEIGLGGAAITAGALIGASTLSEDVVGADPTAKASELVPSETPIEQDELQSGDPTQERPELQPTDTTIEQTELDVSGDIQTPEVSVPTGEVFGPELSVGETTDTTQTGEPSGETVVPGDFPLAGRDVPADPTREYTRRETPESVLDTSPAFQTPEQQERTEQRQQEDTIGREEIPEQLPEIDQPAPSVRERQRREGLFAPQRAFPTGKQAVVGRETTETIEETQRRVEEAQTPFGQTAPPSPVSDLLPFVRVDDRTDAAERQAVRTEPVQRQRPETVQEPAQVPRTDVRPRTGLQVDNLLDLDVQQTQIQEQVQEQRQRQVPEQATEYPTPEAYAQQPAYAYPTTPAITDTARTRLRPRLPDTPDADEDDEERQFGGAAAGVFTSFVSPLSGERLETDPDPTNDFGL